MTGFYLSPGYSFSNKQECNIDDIIKVAKEIPLDKFYNKLLEYGVDEDKADQLIEKYKKIPSNDYTIIYEKEEGREKECKGYLVQYASGGNPWRETREQARKAFAILVMDECFKRGWSVQFEII